VSEPAVRREPSSGAVRGTGMWTAVLPFVARGSDHDTHALAEGLAEDVRAGLAKFPYLKVATTPESARYTVEGSVRRAGPTFRVTVELKDLQSGVQLWGNRYDRDGTAANVFAIQDDLGARIIATVGDHNGVLAMSMAAQLRERDVSQLAADELALRFFAFQFNQRPEENLALRGALEAIVARDPSSAMGWACLAAVYRSARLHLGTNVQDAVARQQQAAQRAVELDPGSQLGWESLAAAHFFRRDATAFRMAADRALAINPLNTSIVAILSHLIGYSGEWSRGLDLLNRVMALGTQHPGWFHFLPFVNHFRLGEYEEAWQAAVRVNMPDYPWALLSIAAAAVEVGRWDDAQSAVTAMAKSAPQYLSVDLVRAEWGMMLWDEALLDRFMKSYSRALHGEAAPSV
jgi:TolB-like protein